LILAKKDSCSVEYTQFAIVTTFLHEDRVGLQCDTFLTR
jgi:hypothetical protein